MNSLLQSYPVRFLLVLAGTLFVMWLALFVFTGFGLLLLITLLVADRVAHYLGKVTVFFAVRNWTKNYKTFTEADV
jgi:hypothetical protein